MKKILVSLTGMYIVLLCVFGIPMQVVYADGPQMTNSQQSGQQAGATTQPTASANTGQVTGTVTNISGTLLTIQTAEGEKQLPLASDVPVTRNGEKVNLDQIQPQDNVSVTQGADGRVVAVDAKTQEATDERPSWLWLLAAAIVAGVASWYFFSRRRTVNEEDVKTVKVVEDKPEKIGKARRRR